MATAKKGNNKPAPKKAAKKAVKKAAPKKSSGTSKTKPGSRITGPRKK